MPSNRVILCCEDLFLPGGEDIVEQLPDPCHIIPRHGAMATAYARYRSFTPNYDGYPSISSLVAAGLFYVGGNDWVKCFHCDGSLSSFLPEDDPMKEHCRWYPNCTFVKENITPELEDVQKRHDKITEKTARKSPPISDDVRKLYDEVVNGVGGVPEDRNANKAFILSWMASAWDDITKVKKECRRLYLERIQKMLSDHTRISHCY